jgi:TetR/AcrR family transcriptional repressor of nem operon
MSKVSQAQAQQNKGRVVTTAARLFRERGFDGVGIADLMESAGLTHGAFYAQFPSKQHLMAEACSQAADDLNNMWIEFLEATPKRSLSALASSYLSSDHRDDPGKGCVAASLGADVVHQGPLVRASFTKAVSRFFDLLMALVPARSQRMRRRAAIATYASMVGGMVLARAVNDERLSDEILEAVRAHIADLDRTQSK